MRKSNNHKWLNIGFIFAIFFICFIQIQRLLGLNTEYLGETVDVGTLYYFLIVLAFIPTIVFLFLYTPITIVCFIITFNPKSFLQEKRDTYKVEVMEVLLSLPFKQRTAVVRC